MLFKSGRSWSILSEALGRVISANSNLEKLLILNTTCLTIYATKVKLKISFNNRNVQENTLQTKLDIVRINNAYPIFDWNALLLLYALTMHTLFSSGRHDHIYIYTQLVAAN